MDQRYFWMVVLLGIYLLIVSAARTINDTALEFLAKFDHLLSDANEPQIGTTLPTGVVGVFICPLALCSLRILFHATRECISIAKVFVNPKVFVAAELYLMTPESGYLIDKATKYLVG